MRRSKLSQELCGLLKSGGWTNFTIADLKAAYMKMPTCQHQTDKAAWQFVHRNICRMEMTHLVRRLEGENKTRYMWIGESGAVEANSSAGVVNSGESNDSTVNCLRERLHHYKVEMLSAIGEAEEYDSLCSELPHMRDSVQMLYNEARDRCSKMLGRVRALESILTKQFHISQSA